MKKSIRKSVPRSCVGIGVDLGGSHISAGIMDLKGKLLKKSYVPNPAFPESDEVMNRIKTLVRNLIALHTTKARIIGIGLGSPGSIDAKRGKVLAETPNIRHWANRPIKKELEAEFHLPVFVDNDVNLAALGEKWFGAGKNAENLFCMTIGTGIGGGMIIKNQVYSGGYFYASEIGHLVIEPDGPRCRCGNRGCLETLASGRAIVRRTITALRRHRSSLIRKLAGNNHQNITASLISSAARKGDRLARKIIDQTGRYLALAISYVINLLDPEIVIIGGGVAEAGETLFKSIRKHLKGKFISASHRKVEVRPARLGQNAGIIGAATLVFQKTGYLPAGPEGTPSE